MKMNLSHVKSKGYQGSQDPTGMEDSLWEQKYIYKTICQVPLRFAVASGVFQLREKQRAGIHIRTSKSMLYKLHKDGKT